jgi:hypothetical protein
MSGQLHDFWDSNEPQNLPHTYGWNDRHGGVGLRAHAQ